MTRKAVLAIGAALAAAAVAFAPGSAAAAWWCTYTGGFYPQAAGCPYGGWRWVPEAGRPRPSPPPEVGKPAAAGMALGDGLDEWCAKVANPRSLAICSDPELRRLAKARQKTYDAARARLDAAGKKALLDDQRKWVEHYPVDCGLDVSRPPALPLPEKLRDCLAAAGRARAVYLDGYPQSATEAAAPTKAAAEQQAKPTEAAAGGKAEIAGDAESDGQKKADAAAVEAADRLAGEWRAAVAKLAGADLAKPADDRADYRAVTGKDFIVDGKTLAATSAKVKVKGTYSAEGQFSYLMVGGSFTDPVRVGLLLDDASRAARLRFLECRSKLIYFNIFGCFDVTVLGTATICEVTNLVGQHSEPCIAVEDARFEEKR